MTAASLAIPEVLLLQLDVHADERGWFQEFWNQARPGGVVLQRPFVQDNLAFSQRRVLRGLHFQFPRAQAKLVTVVQGEIFDVAVDVRPDSPTFGRWAAATLTAGRGHAVYIPEGFAHGYQVISDSAHVLYKCTDHYDPACDHALVWNDAEMAIEWPLADPIVSVKDQNARTLAETRAVLTRLLNAR